MRGIFDEGTQHHAADSRYSCAGSERKDIVVSISLIGRKTATIVRLLGKIL